jgi:hypothetical protein
MTYTFKVLCYFLWIVALNLNASCSWRPWTVCLWFCERWLEHVSTSLSKMEVRTPREPWSGREYHRLVGSHYTGRLARWVKNSSGNFLAVNSWSLGLWTNFVDKFACPPILWQWWTTFRFWSVQFMFRLTSEVSESGTVVISLCKASEQSEVSSTKLWHETCFFLTSWSWGSDPSHAFRL